LTIKKIIDKIKYIKYKGENMQEITKLLNVMLTNINTKANLFLNTNEAEMFTLIIQSEGNKFLSETEKIIEQERSKIKAELIKEKDKDNK
jgi:ethanolamine utilization microcompartment shell protein EutL